MIDTNPHLPVGNVEIEMTRRYPETLSSNTGNPESADQDIEFEAADSRPLLRTSEDEFDNSTDGRVPAKREYDEGSPGKLSFWRERYTSRPSRMAICLSSLVAVIVTVLLLLGLKAQGISKTNDNTRHWQGFSKVEYYFAFGDSWTDTHFVPAFEQPSTANPLGNPAWPGLTSSNGPNYVGYLAAKYNQSFIKAYDLAFSGSTIDAGIDRTLFDWLDFYHQIRDQFLKYYTTNETGIPQPIGWNSENSLFSMFFGINDAMVYDRAEPHLDKVFQTYETLVGQLYEASARNFLVLNIPPLDRSPIVREQYAGEEHRFKGDVDALNDMIKTLVSHLRAKYADIMIFEFDVHDLFGRVVDDPKITPQTTVYKNTMDYCKGYDQTLEFGHLPTKEMIAGCGGLDLEEYLWYNSLHVTWPIHDAIAAGIAKLLSESDEK